MDTRFGLRNDTILKPLRNLIQGHSDSPGGKVIHSEAIQLCDCKVQGAGLLIEQVEQIIDLGF